MGTVRDPNFWKRFSIAVHEDDARKEEQAQRPNITHSYVSTLTLASSQTHNRTPSSPLASPTSQTHIIMDSSSPPTTAPQALTPTLSSPFPKFSQHPKPMTPVVLPPIRTTTTTTQTTTTKSPLPSLKLTHSTTTRSTTSPTTPTAPHFHTPHSNNTTQDPGTPSRGGTFSNKFSRHHANSSTMTLGLSGRPQSRFKFWTDVSADPSNRDSWLEGQHRKRRQRAYMCWGFWAGLLLIVAGVVAAILVLKSRGIM